MTKQVTNTAKDERHQEWVMGGSPGAIEAQEKRGQSDLVNSTQLPSTMQPDTRAVLEAAGVVFGELTPGDPLFCEATLPAGWTKSPTAHSMHIDLLDANGHKRANIFYKASFYDRTAILSACRRFGVDRYSYGIDHPGHSRATVTDAKGEVKFKTEVQHPREGEQEWAPRDRVALIAERWLNENYPDWNSCGAYWDSENLSE
jgi:hypothetical protein